MLGVEDLGVPLQPVEAAARVLEGGHRRLGGGGGDGEALGGGLDRVTVTHPHHLVVRGAVEQARALLHAGGGVPVLAGAGAPDRSAQGLGHGLESVADAQDRHSSIEEGRINGGGAVGVDRGGAAGEDDGRRPLVQHGGGIHGVGHDLGVDTGLAHAAGDELGVLGAQGRRRWKKSGWSSPEQNSRGGNRPPSALPAGDDATSQRCPPSQND